MAFSFSGLGCGLDCSTVVEEGEKPQRWQSRFADLPPSSFQARKREREKEMKTKFPLLWL